MTGVISVSEKDTKKGTSVLLVPFLISARSRRQLAGRSG